jgi:hypothetical protein
MDIPNPEIPACEYALIMIIQSNLSNRIYELPGKPIFHFVASERGAA